MTKADRYRETLRQLQSWDAFLMAESGLPGPRGNLELVQAVADEGDELLFRRFLSLDAQEAPTNSPEEFLVVCGVVGMGRLAAEGRRDLLATLRQCASDPRWRMREGVAMALQRVGDADMALLLEEMDVWSDGNPLEKRAAVAALCEPRLLHDPVQVAHVLRILDKVTASISGIADRRSDEFKALRKGLGYCWSVAVAAFPEEGKKAMERWFSSDDPDVIWIMRENLRKDRLARLDAAWVAKWRTHLGV
jgi:hypothetical protein